MIDIKIDNKYPSNILSNFAHNRFVFDNIQCESMEGFLQSLKYENPKEQIGVCCLCGLEAKLKSRGKRWSKYLYWKGVKILRTSDIYTNFIRDAYEELVQQNDTFRQALIDTGEEVLVHSIGWCCKNETILTSEEFCDILMGIREDLLDTRNGDINVTTRI